MNCFKPYDIFISHVAEDKEEIVSHLVKVLRKKGFIVWYSSDTLAVGASIISSVEKGLSQSRYGIVVLSRKYIESNWGVFELFYLISNRNKRNIEIIPVWHNITSDEVKTLSYGVMIDIYGISTIDGIDNVVSKLLLQLERRPFLCSLASVVTQYIVKRKKIVFFYLAFLFALIIAMLTFWHYMSLFPADTFLDEVIKARILHLDQVYLDKIGVCTDTSFSKIMQVRQEFDIKESDKSHVSYRYITGYKELKSKAALKGIGLTPESISAYNYYSLEKSTACLLENKKTKEGLVFSYKFTNLNRVKYIILSKQLYGEKEFRVKVRYINWIRGVWVECIHNKEASLKQETIRIIGANPDEEFVFENKQGRWEFMSLAEDRALSRF